MVVDSLALVITAITGLYFGLRFSVKEILGITWAGTQAGVLISYLAIKNSWTESIDPNGNWVGIYFNRNSLGPVALVAMVAGSAVFVSLLNSKKVSHQAITFSVFGILMTINLTTLVRSQSTTPILALVGAGAGVLSWSLFTSVSRSRFRFLRSVHKQARLWYLSSSVFAVWLVFRFQDTIGRVVNSDDIFNGRSAFWNFSWTGFLERPLIGWGWRAAWFTPEFLKRDMLWTTAGSNWSHSAYLEILLGGGLIGFVLFASFVICGAYWLLADEIFSVDTRWRTGAAFFVLTASTQEVFIIGNHFLLVVLVAALSAPRSSENHTYAR